METGFSAADPLIGASLITVSGYGVKLGGTLDEYVNRLSERPSFRASFEMDTGDH